MLHQRLPQRLAGAKQARHDGADGQSEDGGDVAVGQLLDLAQHQAGAQILRQAGDGAGEAAGLLAGLQAFLRVGRGVGEAGSAGFIGLTCAIAAASVAGVSVLGSRAKPIWLSEICAKVKPVSAAAAVPIRAARGMPPATVQSAAVPAQAMQERAPRRV